MLERRHPDLNWGIKVLQTSALPLGYSAKFVYIYIYANLEKIFIKNLIY